MQQCLYANISVFEAKHVFSDNDIRPSDMVTPDLIPDDDRDAGGIPCTLRLSIGTKVMLLRNINTIFGLVNGAVGTVQEMPNMEDTNPSISVMFENMGSSALVNKNGCVQIPLYDQEFLVEGRFIIRTNFPLTPCWGSTIHKVQGLSLDSAAIAIGPTVFTKGQGYVALSRVKILRNLYLLSFSTNSIICDPIVINEYLRLSMIDTDKDLT